MAMSLITSATLAAPQTIKMKSGRVLEGEINWVGQKIQVKGEFGSITLGMDQLDQSTIDMLASQLEDGSPLKTELEKLEKTVVSTAPPTSPTTPSTSKATATQTIDQNPKSKIAVDIKQEAKETKHDNEYKCHSKVEYFYFQPSVVLGFDTHGKSPIFRFYIISNKWVEEKKRAEFDISIVADVPMSDESVLLKPIKHRYFQWLCRCCRSKDGELLGWYAELVDGDKVITKTQSSMNSNLQAKLQTYIKDNANSSNQIK
jgi:hypothetical protein